MSFMLASADPGGTIPRIVEKALATGYAEAAGALTVVNGSDQWAACGADPALIAAVQNGAGGADTSGFNILGRKEFPPGYSQGILVGNGVLFSALYIGTLPAANGGSYGVIRDSDGIWKVDFNEVTNVVLTLVGRETDSPENQPRVLIRFLDSVVQPA